MRRLLLLGCLLMVGCDRNEPVSRINPHTGVITHTSENFVLEIGRDAALQARAAFLTRGDETYWMILTSVSRDDGNYPYISSAWSGGRELPYIMHDRRFRDCDTAAGCVREEAGEIRLSRALFERIGKDDGLTFQLSGLRGQYTGKMPARAFVEVLRRSSATP